MKSEITIAAWFGIFFYVVLLVITDMYSNVAKFMHHYSYYCFIFSPIFIPINFCLYKFHCLGMKIDATIDEGEDKDNRFFLRLLYFVYYPLWSAAVIVGGEFVGTTYYVDGVFSTVFGFIGHIIFGTALFIAAPIIVLMNIHFTPHYIGAYVYLTNTPGAVTKLLPETKTRRSSAMIEKEIAALMRAERVEDKALRDLFHELPIIDRWLHTLRYRVKAHKLRGVRELAEAQKDAIAEDIKTGLSAHDLEKAKREADDR